MGVLTSLGQGQADNWRALTAGALRASSRISRFPIDGLRTTIAGTVDFVPRAGTLRPGAVARRSPPW